MNVRTRLRILPVVAALTALVTAGTSFAAPGHGGGGHAAGGFHGVAHAAGGFHGGGAYGGYHGGAYGGYHGGYGGYGGYHGGYGGWHGGYGYGYRGGYYGGRYWGPGWGYGLGLGLFVAALPWYYSTYWWNGVPYYYADNTYYIYNDSAGQYESVAPPAGLQAPADGQGQDPNGGAPAQVASAAGPSPQGNQIFMYPRQGQSSAQQATDRTQCDQWASQQTGAGAASRSPDYYRANAACLEARGYSVK